ncbi:hypothetical protein ABQD61_09990 [Enterococcus asini]|uniref:hypothetical protein n=1 Tax=Enterococcus asini TaxID=57732 RepID=UPI0032E523BB
MKKFIASSLVALSLLSVGSASYAATSTDVVPPTPRIKVAIVEDYYTVTQYSDGSYSSKRDKTTRELRYNTRFVRTGYNNISRTPNGSSIIWRRQNTYNVW